MRLIDNKEKSISKVGAIIVAAGRGERMGGVAISIESQREA